MRFSAFKQDKGVAGLTILLSVVAFLFVIGLIIMIFSLMGGELLSSDTVSAQYSNTAVQTAVAVVDSGVALTTCSGATAGAITSITSAYNVTGAGLVPANNYSISGCTLTVQTDSAYNASSWNVTYAYSYAGASYDVMNDTISGISDTTDWFSIFIVITAMVVLILLTVIIITAIRGSGLISGEGKSNAGNIGSA